MTLCRVNSGDEGATLFGRGSVLHEMLRLARAANKTSDIWALGVETSRPASPPPRPLPSPGRRRRRHDRPLHQRSEAVDRWAAGDAASAVATAIAAVVNGYQNGPVTAAAAAGVVTLTARHKGAFTQGIGVLVNFYDDESLPAGLTLEIASGVTGTGNPDAADVVAAISDEWFYTIISPWSDSANMAIIEAELDSRFGGMDMRTGHVFTGMAGTHAQLTTYGSARNNEHSSFIGVKNPPQAPYLWAAVQCGGRVQRRHRPGAPLPDARPAGPLAAEPEGSLPS